MIRGVVFKAGLAAAAVLVGLAAPGEASTVLSFVSTGTACSGATCGTVTGTGGSVTAMNILDFTGFTETINGNTTESWTLTGASLLFNGTNSFTLTAGATCTAGCVGDSLAANSPLLTFVLSAAPTYSGSQLAGYGINIGTGTSLTETATFLNDLGLTTPTGALTGLALTANTVTGTAITSGTNFTASNTLSITTSQTLAATPEPVSLLLFGTGLCAIGFISRRKSGTAAAAQKS